jgi:hypothetical protein
MTPDQWVGLTVAFAAGVLVGQEYAAPQSYQAQRSLAPASEGVPHAQTVGAAPITDPLCPPNWKAKVWQRGPGEKWKMAGCV